MFTGELTRDLDIRFTQTSVTVVAALVMFCLMTMRSEIIIIIMMLFICFTVLLDSLKICEDGSKSVNHEGKPNTHTVSHYPFNTDLPHISGFFQLV